MNRLAKVIKTKVYQAVDEKLKFDRDLFEDILFKEAAKGNIDYRFRLEILSNNNYKLNGQIVKENSSETIYNLYVNDINLFINYLTLEGFIVYDEEDHIVISLNNLTMTLA